MVSARVPSRSSRAVPPKATEQIWCKNIFLCYKLLNTKYFSNALSILSQTIYHVKCVLRFTDWFIKISIKAEDIDNGVDSIKVVIFTCESVGNENKNITQIMKPATKKKRTGGLNDRQTDRHDDSDSRLSQFR